MPINDNWWRLSTLPQCGKPDCYCAKVPAPLLSDDPDLKPPDQSFEARVIALAETLFDNKRNLTGYEWGHAIADAIAILATEEYL